jgi:hypothetical protein
MVEQSPQLLERREFQGWFPRPERIAPLAEEWERADQGRLAVPPTVVAQRRNEVMGKVIELILGPGGLAGFRRRLEDNALVLLRGGERRAARLAVAAAARLDPADPAGAAQHPLVATLARRALDEALAEVRERGGQSLLAGMDELDEGEGDDLGLERRPSGLIIPR